MKHYEIALLVSIAVMLLTSAISHIHNQSIKEVATIAEKALEASLNASEQKEKDIKEAKEAKSALPKKKANRSKKTA